MSIQHQLLGKNSLAKGYIVAGRVLQRGFTMVELAIVLVVAGLILTAVLKGTDTINKAKVERAVADLKGLQAMVLETEKRIGRKPGDCNGDGVVRINPPSIRNFWLSAEPVGYTIDKTERNPSNLGVCGAAGSTPFMGSGNGEPAAWAGGANARTTINLPYSEMRRTGVVDGHRTNLELAKHVFGDVMQIAHVSDYATASQRINVIIMYGVPIWAAEAIDAEIDGVSQNYGTRSIATGPACTGRVRTISNTNTGIPAWYCLDGQYDYAGAFSTATKRGKDDLIAIIYMYDTIKLPG